jgi:hypothetical protein
LKAYSLEPSLNSSEPGSEPIRINFGIV